MRLLLLLLIFPLTLFSSPFPYDLHFTRIYGFSPRTMICFHGMGGNHRIADVVKVSAPPGLNLVSFNFPDHDVKPGCDIYKTSFGTIRELLPALHVLKRCIIDEKMKQIDLYGYSAGGGALVNTLAVLNSNTHDFHLQLLGIGEAEKKQILDVIQKGVIILDTPLKSLGEILSFRGGEVGVQIVAKRYLENEMEPIDAIAKLENLALHVIIHFQTPDNVLSNRDDLLYIERFQKYNRKGTTTPCLGFDAGHGLPHPTLWHCYQQMKRAPL